MEYIAWIIGLFFALLAFFLLIYAIFCPREWLGLLPTRPHLIPSLVTVLMLIMATMNGVYHPSVYHPSYFDPSYYTGWGFFDPSDGYFLLLRWAVMVVSLYIAYKGYQWKKIWVSWLFGFIAILFNPLAQITFERGTWQVFDVLCALAFLTAGFLIHSPAKTTA